MSLAGRQQPLRRGLPGNFWVVAELAGLLIVECALLSCLDFFDFPFRFPFPFAMVCKTKVSGPLVSAGHCLTDGCSLLLHNKDPLSLHEARRNGFD